MSKLTDEQIRKLQAVENLDILNGQYEPYKFARAIEAAATEPLLQRIAELERVCDIFEGNWNECLADCENIAALKERIAELERQLEEARKQMESQKDEWLSWEAKRKALEKDAERYRWLRLKIYIDPKEAVLRIRDTYLVRGRDVPEGLDAAIDAAMQKGQS